MSDRPRIGLDDPAFSGRLHRPAQVVVLSLPSRPRQALGPRIRYHQDVVPAPKMKKVVAVDAVLPTHHPVHQPSKARPHPQLQVVAPQPFATPAYSKQQQSRVLLRQAVRSPNQKTPVVKHVLSESPKVVRPKIRFVLLGMAAFVFIVGLLVSFMTMQTNRDAKTQVAALSKNAENADGSASSDGAPAEVKPSMSDLNSYKVAPDLPKYIKIPSLYVYSRIKPMSVNGQNELQAPASIYDAGWYNASARPGDGGGSGAMLIDGHVHGPTLPGIFANIKKLKAGDSIQIVRGDDTTYEYSVVATQEYDAANLSIAKGLASIKPGQSGLNLITCSGSYDKKSGDYSKRTIVFAARRS